MAIIGYQAPKRLKRGSFSGGPGHTAAALKSFRRPLLFRGFAGGKLAFVASRVLGVEIVRIGDADDGKGHNASHR
jgi:hypothetical protein